MRKKLIILSLLMYPLLSVSGCNSPSDFGTTVANGFKDVFIPKADLTITSVGGTTGVGVKQTFISTPAFGTQSTYTYSEPTVTIINRAGLPRVIFKQILIDLSIGDKKLSQIKAPITVTIPNGGQFIGTIPVLSSASESIITAIYPNNSPTNLKTGFADVLLLGVDDSSNLISLKFTTAITFQSDVSGITAPAATPSPSGSPL